MNDQGWNIKDVYRNTTRDDMPNDETLTSLENTLIEAARLAIKSQGGELSNERWKSRLPHPHRNAREHRTARNTRRPNRSSARILRSQPGERTN